MSGWLGYFFFLLEKPKLAGVVVCSVGPRGHSSGSKQGAGRGFTVGWEASEGVTQWNVPAHGSCTATLFRRQYNPHVCTQGMLGTDF